MPHASLRAEEMPASPIRRLIPFAVAAESRGTSVHYLNIGQPDIASPASFWKGLREAETETLEYSPSPGLVGLRRAAIDDYQKRGLPVESEDLLITNGGSEATLFAFLACFNPGDEVIVVEPYYANYHGFAVEAGITLVALTTHLSENFALPGVDQIEAKITSRTRGILICNPSNPTGTSFTTEQLEALAKCAKDRNLFLIVDEVYRDFNYTDIPLVSILNLDGMAEHGVMIDSVSKRFSLCGARVGFLVSKNKGVMSGVNKFAQARLSVPSLEQAGVANAIIETPQSYFAEVRNEYMHRRDVLLEELATIPGVTVPAVNGAFYAIVGLPVEDAEEFCKWLLTDFSHDGETVMMAPAEGFYLTPGLGKSEVRIAYVLEEGKLRRAMKCLGLALQTYPHLKQLASTH